MSLRNNSNHLCEPLLDHNYQTQLLPNSVNVNHNTNLGMNESQQVSALQEGYNNDEGSPRGSSNDNYFVDNEKEGLASREDSVSENKDDKNYFWLFFKSVFITEFGDRTQFGMAAISSVYNVIGVLVGSLIGLGAIVYIACYHGESAAKKIIEKQMCIIVGFVFLGLSVEIYYSNNYFRIM